MSYRSIKRVLGETSLERKCRLLFGACLFLLITASFWWYESATEKLVHEQNRITAKLLVGEEMVVKHWATWESTPGWKKRIDPFTKYLGKQEGTVEFILPNSRDGRGAAPQDDYERQVVERFMKDKPKVVESADALPFAEHPFPKTNSYQYYEPIRAGNSSCLTGCHVSTAAGGSGMDPSGSGLMVPPIVIPAEGDLIAVAKVTISNEPVQHKLYKNRALFVTIAIVTVVLAMLTSYIIVRYVIVKPLRHLRDVSDAISRGNISLRADIRTGDEFEELAVAFNRMLRHLVTVQEELRQANVNLDSKVDDLAQVNMRLYEMNTVKSDFLATMSHELRTPLNSILGFSDVLGSIDSLDDKQKRYVQNIQKSGRSLLDMINDILDLAKIESGKMDTRLTDFRIAQVVAAQCDMARPLTEKKNIDLETTIPADLPPMRQDQARVQQILNNLLSNAIKFTPEGGRITVTVTRESDDMLVLRVADTGVGIAEEDQQVIFEKFRQGRVGAPSGDAMTREYSGSGLGLSIVKELCKLLGGSVAVESELGRGSTFTIRLPWTLQEQPRLDSPLIESLDDFAGRVPMGRGPD